ncbi:hypothetical protein ACN27G_24935 [Plantactinospora sp. WMMB334]|uniref:hypothetical protein n=1 Tax=Plantactinospora sp. WMMB334 TaxID=3404119 RepID=UPI003B946C5D
MTRNHLIPVDLVAVVAGGLLLVAGLVLAGASTRACLRLRFRLNRLLTTAPLVMLFWALVSQLIEAGSR